MRAIIEDENADDGVKLRVSFSLMLSEDLIMCYTLVAA